eukprot:XP_011428188.1 PREDICTED: uncharacterized protein LOC105328852 [Crassostrea gigas]
MLAIILTTILFIPEVFAESGVRGEIIQQVPVRSAHRYKRSNPRYTIDCADSPCIHGTCIYGTFSYHCDCNVFFGGINCDEVKAGVIVSLVAELVGCAVLCFLLIGIWRKKFFRKTKRNTITPLPDYGTNRSFILEHDQGGSNA